MLLFTHILNLKNLQILYRTKLKYLLMHKWVFFITKIIGLNFEPRIIARDDILSGNTNYVVREFGCEELAKIRSLCSCKGLKEITEKDYNSIVTINKPFICEVNNAELVGPNAVGFDRDGNLISETAVPLFSREIYLKKNISTQALFLKKTFRNSNIQLDTACSLVCSWSNNYWHWMVDCLTRIEGLEAYCKQTGIKPALIIESNLKSWQFDSLKLLGYDPNDCIRWNGSKVHVKKLIVPSFRRHWDYYDNKRNKTYGSIISPMACRWIRQRMLSNLSSSRIDRLSFSSNIFISRRNALQRRILNEHEVMEALVPFGFVAYTLEELNFSEQVRLFSQAKMVVAPHGAGLANMIFSQNLTVIELFGSYVLNSAPANLAVGLGFQYEYIRGQSPPQDSRKLHADMIVDVAELKNILARIYEA